MNQYGWELIRTSSLRLILEGRRCNSGSRLHVIESLTTIWRNKSTAKFLIVVCGWYSIRPTVAQNVDMINPVRKAPGLDLA